jgi:glycosyltransferase involved in cell wall biosynthesis
MKILHLAAGNRWTGAAAPAFAEVEALRAAGIDAHYAYVGGYKLEAKIGHLPWAHAILEKSQNPVTFARSVRAIQTFADREHFDVLHAHLTWDHALARFAARGRSLAVARTFHSRRVLRTDLFTRALVARTGLLFVVNDAFRDAPALHGREAVFTPPPLDHAQFTAAGPSARGLYGIPSETKLVTIIGKVAPGRGFEEALHTFASLRPLIDGVRMMIIGHGPHRPFLEALSRSLAIDDAVLWAGYHEEDLAEHYRASDLLLFTERGSDEGHRAVLEALACGVPVAAYPIEGVEALLPPDAIAGSREPAALAAIAASLLRRNREELRAAAVGQSQQFGYVHAAERLLSAYGQIAPGLRLRR